MLICLQCLGEFPHLYTLGKESGKYMAFIQTEHKRMNSIARVKFKSMYIDMISHFQIEVNELIILSHFG